MAFPLPYHLCHSTSAPPLSEKASSCLFTWVWAYVVDFLSWLPSRPTPFFPANITPILFRERSINTCWRRLAPPSSREWSLISQSQSWQLHFLSHQHTSDQWSEKISAKALLKDLKEKSFSHQAFGLMLECDSRSPWSHLVNTGRQDRGPTLACWKWQSKKVEETCVFVDINEHINQPENCPASGLLGHMIISWLSLAFGVGFLLLELKTLDIPANIVLQYNQLKLRLPPDRCIFQQSQCFCSRYCMTVQFHSHTKLQLPCLCWEITKDLPAHHFPSATFLPLWKPLSRSSKNQEALGQIVLRQYTHTIILYVDIFVMSWIVSPPPNSYVVVLIPSTSNCDWIYK